VASGTTVWRAGRRGGARDDGEGIEIEAARRRGGEEGAARREWDGGSPFRPLEMGGSYRKATEILSKSISVTPPCYRNLYRILVGDFATDPSPTEILPKTYRNPLHSGLSKPKNIFLIGTYSSYCLFLGSRYEMSPKTGIGVATVSNNRAPRTAGPCIPGKGFS
jgi:hypothetical protein